MFVTKAYGQSSVKQNASTETNSGTEIKGHGENQAADAVFPPFDQTIFTSQLLWLAITFGTFYLLVSKFVAPRIGGILEVRNDRIAEDLDAANRLKEESDKAIATYEQELTQARHKAHEIATKSHNKAKQDTDNERARHEEDLNKRLAESDAHIAKIKAKALVEVNGIAIDTASTIVEQLLEAKASKTEVTAAVRDVVK